MFCCLADYAGLLGFIWLLAGLGAGWFCPAGTLGGSGAISGAILVVGRDGKELYFAGAKG